MIQIPLEIGDVILTGRFKNHRVSVKEIETDEHGLPTVNGRGILKIRIEKLMKPKQPVKEGLQVSDLTPNKEYSYYNGVDYGPVIYKGLNHDKIHHIFSYKDKGGTVKLTRNNVFRHIELIRESTMKKINEAPTTNDPKVQRVVDSINALIKSAIDSDGDPIEVTDSTGTWEEPMVYDPIIYSNGRLKISYTEPLNRNKKNEEWISKANMEFDGIPTLRNIAKMYKKAIKQNNLAKPTTENKMARKFNHIRETVEPDKGGIEVKITEKDKRHWIIQKDIDKILGDPTGYETKELANQAALINGFIFPKADEMAGQVPEVPKATKAEPTKFEKPKEIDPGKPKEIKLEEDIKRIIREEIKLLQKKNSISEAPKITPKIEKAILELEKMHTALRTAQAKVDAIMKETGLKDLQKKTDTLLKEDLWNFFEELKRDDQRIVKLKNIVLNIDRFQAQPATYEYEKVLDLAMTYVNQDVKQKILDDLKASERIGKTKGSVSFAKVEGVGDVWNSIVSFLSKILPSMKSKGKKLDGDLDKLDTMVSNMK